MRVIKRELLSGIRRYRLKSAFFFNFIKIFGVMALFVAVIGSSFVYINNRNIKNEGMTVAENSSQKVYNAMDAYLDDARKIVANFLVDSDIQWFMNENSAIFDEEVLCGKIKSKMYSYKNLAKGIDSIYIYSAKSDKIICNQGIYDISEFDDTGWLENGEKDKSIRIVPRKNRDVKLISVIGEYNENSGAVIVNINVNMMRQDLLKEFPDVNARIINSENIVFSTITKEFMGNLTEFHKENEEYKNLNSTQIIEYDYKNNDFDLTYLIQIPIVSYTDIANTVTATAVIFISIILLLGIGISAIFAAYLSMPISNWGNMLSIYEKEDNVEAQTEIDNITQKIIALIDNNEKLKSEMDKKMTEFKRLQLMSLQTQINPHYMNNTLGVIGLKLALKCGWEDEIVSMINNLSESLRYSFKTDNMSTTVGEELEFLNKYISIINYCYPSIDINIGADKSIYNFNILRVSIQPLVENSIFHGMKNKDGGGYININLKSSEEYMELTVEDNGNGMSDEAVEEIKANFRNSEIKGVGLKNVLKRFDLYYGEKFSFELSGNGGTTIKIKYPRTM